MSQPHFTILGGGISGLSLAYFLRQRIQANLTSSSNLLSPSNHHQLKKIFDIKITIIESKPRIGGWIKSNVSNEKHIFERGPRGFRPNGNGVEILRLAEELQLSSDAVKTSDASKHRFLYVQGKLQQMPAGLSDLITLPSVLQSAVKGILKEPLQPKLFIHLLLEDLVNMLQKILLVVWSVVYMLVILQSCQ
jgi:oxygen-dependent protoporphyrinogen oxidase